MWPITMPWKNMGLAISAYNIVLTHNLYTELIMVLEFHRFSRTDRGFNSLIVTNGGVGQDTAVGVIPQFEPCRMLWDTGAQTSCVTSRMVNLLGLKPVGKATFQDYSGNRESLIYKVTFCLPDNLIVSGVPVSESFDNQQYDVILGLDIISHGDFHLTGQGGDRTLSFCYPSIEKLTFEGEVN